MERKLGIILPRELSNGRDLLNLAREAEKLGYDYLVACDHVVLPDQDSRADKLKYALDEQYTDPLTLLAAIAAVTTNIELFTGVLVLPQRPTALVARQAADVDILSNGKLNLGVGVGWSKDEFEALGEGETFSHRGKRIEEQIALLRLLWTQNSVTFSSQHEQLNAVGINPKPVRQPIPVWMGGTDVKVIDRSVRLADGWIPRGKAVTFNDRLSGQLKDALEVHQRDAASLPVMGKVNVRWETRENNWQQEGDDWLENPLVTHLSVGSIGGNKSKIDGHLEILSKAKTYFK